MTLTASLPQRHIAHRYLLLDFDGYHVAEGIAQVARNASTNHTELAEVAFSSAVCARNRSTTLRAIEKTRHLERGCSARWPRLPKAP